MPDKNIEMLTTRSIPVISGSYDKEKHSARVTAVTENPVQVYDMERWDIVNEVILMDGVMLPENGQVPLLDSHDRSTIEKILGSGRDFVTTGKQKDATIFFTTAEEGANAELKLSEGHLTDLSIGYKQLESVWIEKGTKLNIMGRDFEGPLRVTTKCLIKELSLTPIGADAYAKVRSELTDEKIREMVKDILNKPASGEVGAGSNQSTITTGKERTMEPTIPGAPAGQITKSPDEIRAEERKSERERQNAIDAYGKRFVGRVEKIDELMETAKRDGTSIELFKGIIADILSEKGEPITQDHKLGLSNQEQKRYSISKFIHAAAMQKRELAPFEFECSEEVEKKLDLGGAVINRTSISKNAASVWIPHDIMHRSMDATRQELLSLARQYDLLHKRDLSAGSTADGGYLIGTNLLASEFIQFPRNMTLMALMGARVMEGMTGNVDIPKKIGSSSFYYVSTEGNPPTESALTTGKVSLHPHIGGTFTDYTLQLLLQSTPSVDALVQADLLETCDVGIDYGCFHGSNASGEPKGLVNQSSIGSVDGTDLYWETVVEFLTDVMTGNSMGLRMGFATNPLIWGYLVTRKKDAYVSEYLADMNSNRMAGQPLYVSNQIAAGYLMFGDWSKAIIAMWGGYNLLVDPYTASSAGTTRVRVLTAHDFAIRLATAFSVASNVT